MPSSVVRCTRPDMAHGKGRHPRSIVFRMKRELAFPLLPSPSGSRARQASTAGEPGERGETSTGPRLRKHILADQNKGTRWSVAAASHRLTGNGRQTPRRINPFKTTIIIIYPFCTTSNIDRFLFSSSAHRLYDSTI